jgi:hypothetical protein
VFENVLRRIFGHEEEVKGTGENCNQEFAIAVLYAV